MQARSQYFDRAVADGGRIVARCDVLSQGVPVLTGIPVTGGTVKGDRGGFVRRSCDVTVADPDLIPLLAGDALAPYGSELRLWRGVVLPDGREELVAVGTFVVWDVESAEPFDGVRVTGYDRMRLVQQARFPFPTSPQTRSAIELVSSLVLEPVPWATILIDPALRDATVPRSVALQRDRDQPVTDVATALGAEIYSDAYGGFVLAPIPDPSGPPVARFQRGEGGVLVSRRRKLSREGVYNACVASGQQAGDEPVVTSDLIIDSDPMSPTYWDGPFGHAPTFYSSSFLTTKNQANDAARAILRDQVGLVRSLGFDAIPNPALEVGDVIGLDSDDGYEQHILETLTMPLGAGTMTADTRTTTYTLS